MVKDLIKWEYTFNLCVPIKHDGKTTNIVYENEFVVEINKRKHILKGISNKVAGITTDDMPYGFFLN